MGCRPVYGLIFLFKWQKEKPDDKRVVLEGGVPGVFFAQQVRFHRCSLTFADVHCADPCR